MADLKPSYRTALGRVAKGGILIRQRQGLAPEALVSYGSGAHAQAFSAPALRALLGEGLVAAEGEGDGIHPLAITEAGRAALRGVATVERFDPALKPDSGRPRIAEFTNPATGKLGVHVQREDGSLWLFAEGTKGGDRGRVVLPVRYAGAVAEWLEGDRERALSGSGGFGYLGLRGDRLKVGKAGWSQDWHIDLGPEALATFEGLLREWARQASAVEG